MANPEWTEPGDWEDSVEQRLEAAEAELKALLFVLGAPEHYTGMNRQAIEHARAFIGADKAFAVSA